MKHDRIIGTLHLRPLRYVCFPTNARAQLERDPKLSPRDQQQLEYERHKYADAGKRRRA